MAYGAKDIQQKLNNYGYNLAVDGLIGSKTQSAIKDFQKNNGLAVDGIVGPNTWAALTGGTTETKSPSFKYDDFKYDAYTPKEYKESDTVKQAQAALNAQLAQKPGEYKSQWQAQLDDTIGKILNREKFSYDLNGDALYQLYKDKYTQQAKMAMGDAIGRASAMTGGYGNSYAQSVGQQQYQKEMQNLNDIVPELYQMALDKYNQEGQDLYNQYGMLGAQEEQDYGRYRDSVSDYLTERDYLTNRYDSERDYDYSKFANERNFDYDKYSDDRSLAYNEHRNAIEDQRWQAEFDEAKRRYDESVAKDEQQSDNQTSVSSPSDKAASGAVAGAKVGSQPAKKTFTGSTYDAAVDYAKANGVPTAHAAGIMTASEWNRRRSSYQATGQGGAEVKNYSSYKAYLADITAYLVEKYN